MTALRRLLMWVLAVALGSFLAHGAVVGDSSYAYDGPTTARVDAHWSGAAPDSGWARLSDMRDGSASPPVEAQGRSATSSGSVVPTDTADDPAGVVSWPAGVADDFVSEVANNGKGTVWRALGTAANGGAARIMEPNAQYPKGDVPFYNQGGQPLGLIGRPGPNSATHIPINPDGTHPLPKGWGGAG